MSKINFLDDYTIDDLESIYEEFCEKWDKNLKILGVKKPPRFGTVASLQLVFLYSNLNIILHKKFLQDFVNRYIPTAGDQQPRHLGPQYGFNILTNNDIGDDGISIDKIGVELYKDYDILKDIQLKTGSRSGWIMLKDVMNPHKGWTISQNKRKTHVNKDTWEERKKAYDNRCATCYGKEGEVSHIDGKIITLDKGHMDPSKGLADDNIIPQCTTCNGIYRDIAVFDINGRVVGCGSSELILKSSVSVQLDVMTKLIDQHTEQAYEIFKNKYSTEL